MLEVQHGGEEEGDAVLQGGAQRLLHEAVEAQDHADYRHPVEQSVHVCKVFSFFQFL